MSDLGKRQRGDDMADEQQALLAGQAQGQGPDIFDLARQTQQARPAAPERTIAPGTGVGIIDLFTAPARRAEQQQINTQRAQQRATDFINASGVDINQLSRQEISGLQGLAVSDPAAFNAQIQQVEMAQSLNLSPAQSHQVRRGNVDLRIADQQLIQAGIKSRMDQLTFNQASGAAPDRDLLVSTSRDIRVERAKDLAPYNDSLRSFDELQAALELDSGPASMAVLFKFIKALDDSVVRASEGELLTSSSGPVRALVDQFNQIQAGGLFGEDTKNDIREVATAIAKSQFATAQRINADHDTVAARFAERFGMPSVIELSQSAAFDPSRSFGPQDDTGGGGGGDAGDDDIANMEPPPGFRR